MKILFRKENILKTFLTALYLIAGILFFILLGRMVDFAESVLCSLLIIIGVVCIVIYSILPAESKVYSLLLYGAICAFMGFLILLVPRFFGMVLSIMIGIGGINFVIGARKLKLAGDNSWITSFVIGLVVCALAIVSIVLSGTNIAKNILAIFLGINISIQGIYNLVELILLIKKSKRNIEITDFEVKDDKEN